MTRALSPIERMIDQACGYDPNAPAPLVGDEFGRRVAAEVVGYLQGMYPRDWAKLSKSCQRSLRGSIANNANALAPRFQPKAPRP